MSKRLLVCGGRNFTDNRLLVQELDKIEAANRVSVLINGGAPGADRMAARWARARDVPVETFLAAWMEYGPAAGPIRNQRMIDEGKPDLVVAFPGGAGTADMARRAENAGITVLKIDAG